MGARGALRIGAGLVTVASPPDALAVNAAHLTAIMLLPFEGADGLGQILGDRRKNAVLLGPALGVGEATWGLVEAALASGAAVVLDADAITSFDADAGALAGMIAATEGRPVVLTPHEGEFHRLFPDLGARLQARARARRGRCKAARSSSSKAPDTVIADPRRPRGDQRERAGIPGDGRRRRRARRIRRRAAGAGDAGLRGGVRRRMAARRGGGHFGPGLIAEDLPERLAPGLAPAAAWRGRQLLGIAGVHGLDRKGPHWGGTFAPECPMVESVLRGRNSGWDGDASKACAHRGADLGCGSLRIGGYRYGLRPEGPGCGRRTRARRRGSCRRRLHRGLEGSSAHQRPARDHPQRPRRRLRADRPDQARRRRFQPGRDPLSRIRRHLQQSRQPAAGARLP